MNTLKTVDGAALMSQPLQPVQSVVDTLLSQSLHILAGFPKVGKSWLALWLAVTVAKGEAMWSLEGLEEQIEAFLVEHPDRAQTEGVEMRIVSLFADLLKQQSKWIGTPTSCHKGTILMEARALCQMYKGCCTAASGCGGGRTAMSSRASAAASTSWRY